MRLRIFAPMSQPRSSASRSCVSFTAQLTSQNEFPKRHPEGVSQFVLWTRVPILDRSLCASDQEWQEISARGLMGITGRPGDEAAGIGPSASSEIRKFIACRWPDAETIFFVRSQDALANAPQLNPVENQSVLGIPHVQIMVKER